MIGPSGLVHSETTFWLVDTRWRICFASEGAGLPFSLAQSIEDTSAHDQQDRSRQREGVLLVDVIGPDSFAQLRDTGAVTLSIAGAEYSLTLDSLVACGVPLYFVRVQPADATLAHLVSFIVHELRNPLSAMRALVQGLEEELKDRPDTCTYTERMIAEIDRLGRLLNSMAQFSRLKQRQEETFLLQPVVERVIHLFEQECRQRGVQVQLDVEDQQVEVQGDPDLFIQLFVNLITNGLAAMPAGGVLRIALRGSSSGEVTIQVQDSGVGMTADQLERVSQAQPSMVGGSSPAPAKAGGMGLGLLIVRDIVHRYRGKIYISSAPGHGTSVTITFNNQR